MAKKTTAAKVIEDKDAANYNEAYVKGLEVGDWVVQMLDVPGLAFIIPVNPHQNDENDPELVKFYGWRDGFDEAINQLIDVEDSSFHQILLQMQMRRGVRG